MSIRIVPIIADDAGLQAALLRVQALWDAPSGTPEAAERDALADEIETYEAAQPAVPAERWGWYEAGAPPCIGFTFRADALADARAHFGLKDGEPLPPDVDIGRVTDVRAAEFITIVPETVLEDMEERCLGELEYDGMMFTLPPESYEAAKADLTKRLTEWAEKWVQVNQGEGWYITGDVPEGGET